MTKKIFHLTVLLILVVSKLYAQDKELLMDKPGTFKVTNNTLNGQGPDQYFKSCGYTNAEAEAARKNLVSLVDIFRRSPVLKVIKGFDGEAYLNSGRCNTKFGYGLPSTVKFYFRTWSIRNGKAIQWINEPPEWQFEVNMTEKFCSNGFNESDYSNAYNPTNPAFSEKGANSSTVALRELFFLPGVKEEVCRGIDRYGNNLIIFNSEQPEYWNQVTVREVFRLLIDYWKQVPDKIQVETMVPLLENDFSNFSEAEKDGFAYFGRPESIYRIGSEKNETPVMRPNPDYWNRKLPRSAIQFMWLEIPKKDEVKRLLDANLKEESGYYYVYRLLDELDVKDLLTNIAQ